MLIASNTDATKYNSVDGSKACAIKYLNGHNCGKN